MAEGKKGGLSGMELISGVVLSEDEWTPESVSYLFSSPTRPHIELTHRLDHVSLVWRVNLIFRVLEDI